MGKQQIRREQLGLGVRIVATANPNIGEVLECVAVHPIGYDRRSGGYRHFIEYDFKQPNGGERRGLKLNYINTYFKLASA